ncbi:MAG TPA: class II aldolase/adducin family protein, partial [Beijerinckiaceae bacterium]|nr:class II aldolase/adducin family protein [Beijerinckiaceae bacterium]
MRLMPCGCLCAAGGSFWASAAHAPADAAGAPKPAPASCGAVDPGVIDDLAAASRILADQGVVDAFGHVSMRHPQSPDRYLMSRSLAPALVQPDDIMEYDLDSDPCDPRGRSSFLERFIHGAIYKARPDVTSVVHSHSPSVIPFGLVAEPMRAMYHNAAFLAQGVPVFDISEKFGATDMLVGNHDKGAALAETLADKPVV